MNLILIALVLMLLKKPKPFDFFTVVKTLEAYTSDGGNKASGSR